MKRKVLYCLNSVVQVRTLYDSGFLGELLADHDIGALFSATVQGKPELARMEADARFSSFGYFAARPWRDWLLNELIILSWFEFRRRSNALEVKKNRLGRLKRGLFYLLSTPPAVAAALTRLLLRLLGPDPRLTRLLRELRPDLVCVDSALNECFTLEILLAARACGLKACVTVHNWDNLVTKGTIIIKPDMLGVWGAQHVRQARDVQLMPPERIFVVGAPGFEHYHDFSRQRESRAELFGLYGLEPGARLILFCGSCYPFDELSALRVLDAAIERHRLSEVRILYRPHPWACIRKGERHVRDLGLRRVLLDRQVERVYDGRFGADGRVLPGGVDYWTPDLRYYNMLLKSIDGCVGPYTTLFVELALNKVGIMALSYFDGQNTFIPGDKLATFIHSRDFIERSGLRQCRAFSSLERDFLAFLGELDDPRLRERVYEAGRHVVQVDGSTCAQRAREMFGRCWAGAR